MHPGTSHTVIANFQPTLSWHGTWNWVSTNNRMYNQRGQAKNGPIPESPSADISKKAGGKLYKNPLDCLIQTVRTEGPLAVYKVLSVHYSGNLRVSLHIYYGLLHIPYCKSL
jgi:hypothetical protein